MAKATLQHVRAQYGDNSPATVAAFQSALVTHQRYIKVQLFSPCAPACDSEAC
jgi:hypothetical protein